MSWGLDMNKQKLWVRRISWGKCAGCGLRMDTSKEWLCSQCKDSLPEKVEVIEYLLSQQKKQKEKDDSRRILSLADYPEEQQRVILDAAKSHFEDYRAGRKSRLPSPEGIVFKVYEKMVRGDVDVSS